MDKKTEFLSSHSFIYGSDDLYIERKRKWETQPRVRAQRLGANVHTTPHRCAAVGTGSYNQLAYIVVVPLPRAMVLVFLLFHRRFLLLQPRGANLAFHPRVRWAEFPSIDAGLCRLAAALSLERVQETVALFCFG